MTRANFQFMKNGVQFSFNILECEFFKVCAGRNVYKIEDKQWLGAKRSFLHCLSSTPTTGEINQKILDFSYFNNACQNKRISFNGNDAFNVNRRINLETHERYIKTSNKISYNEFLATRSDSLIELMH